MAKIQIEINSLSMTESEKRLVDAVILRKPVKLLGKKYTFSQMVRTVVSPAETIFTIKLG